MDDETRAFEAEDHPTQRMPAEDEPTQVVSGGLDDFPTRRFDPATPLGESHTEVLDIPPDPRAERATGLAVAFIIIALVVAALIGYFTRVPHPAGVVAGPVLVGPNGGSIPFDGSGRLEIQKGALSQATTITIRKVKLNDEVKLHRQDGSLLVFAPGEVTMYTFEPENTSFNQPVTVRLPAPANADAALVVSSDVRVINGTEQGNVFVVKTNNFAFR